jgi:integrase
MERDARIDITPLALVAVHKRLQGIEELLQAKIPNLSVEEAVSEFWQRHLDKTKRPRPYRYVLDRFVESFSGRNICDVSAEEIDGFLTAITSTPNTRAYRGSQLRGLFGFANKLLLMRKSPGFPNPLDLLTYGKEVKDTKFVATSTVQAMVQAAESDRERLTVLILASTGLRTSELAELSPEDVRGRIITVRNPKGLRYNNPNQDYTETAVMPAAVAGLLQEFLRESREKDNLLGDYKRIYKVIKRLAKRVGADLTPHDLRRFCATFWERREEYGMVRFVLRHKTDSRLGDPLARFYIAPLTVEEVMVKQDLLMENFMENQETEGPEE